MSAHLYFDEEYTDASRNCNSLCGARAAPFDRYSISTYFKLHPASRIAFRVCPDCVEHIPPLTRLKYTEL